MKKITDTKMLNWLEQNHATRIDNRWHVTAVKESVTTNRATLREAVYVLMTRAAEIGTCK